MRWLNSKINFNFRNNKINVRGGILMASPKDTHGPIVKTGPTAGQNRSKNADGTWRAKRSDAGEKRPKK